MQWEVRGTYGSGPATKMTVNAGSADEAATIAKGQGLRVESVGMLGKSDEAVVAHPVASPAPKPTSDVFGTLILYCLGGWLLASLLAVATDGARIWNTLAVIAFVAAIACLIAMMALRQNGR